MIRSICDINLKATGSRVFHKYGLKCLSQIFFFCGRGGVIGGEVAILNLLKQNLLSHSVICITMCMWGILSSRVTDITYEIRRQHNMLRMKSYQFNRWRWQVTSRGVQILFIFLRFSPHWNFDEAKVALQKLKNLGDLWRFILQR